MENFLAVLVIFGIGMNNIEEAQSAPAPQSIPPLISFQDGKIGVNFLGFHAAAGLNGQGLHAEAGTPFGQKASAGLGGSLGNDGAAAGRLYAGATAGGNIRAAAGLGGGISGGENSRAAGGLFSAASAGGAQAGKTLSGGIGDGKSYSVVESIESKPRKVVIDEDEDEVESTRKEITRDENRTTNTKTVDVAYVPIRKVKNRVRVRGHPVRFHKYFVYGNSQQQPETRRSSVVKEVIHDVNSDHDEEHEKENENRPSVVTYRKTVQKPITATKVYRYETAPAAESPSGPGPQGFLDAFFGTTNNGHQSLSHTSYVNVEKSNNQRPNSFFDDIFNIPISTLSAVSKFLSNSVPSHGGVTSVKKTVTVS